MVIGAPRSLILREKLNRVLSHNGRRKTPVQKSAQQIRFCDAVFKSMETIEIPRKTPTGLIPIIVTVNIVASDILALLVLNIVDV